MREEDVVRGSSHSHRRSTGASNVAIAELHGRPNGAVKIRRFELVSYPSSETLPSGAPKTLLGALRDFETRNHLNGARQDRNRNHLRNLLARLQLHCVKAEIDHQHKD